MHRYFDLEQRYGANNYAPAPITFAHGSGVWLYDDQNQAYLDMMSAYSAASFGHTHPQLIDTLTTQANKLAVISRAFRHDRLGPFLQRLCTLVKMDKALLMNTGAEAVETAIKAARKWGYRVKGIPAGQAKIIVCNNNFHGRTTTIVGFSSQPQYRNDFAPFDTGFTCIPFGDIEALRTAITKETAAFLVEPIQGEGGVIVPPKGYLEQAAEICRQHNVLLIADEVQTGLARTGKILASWHENVQPDGVILGKALGGGLLPVSAFVAKATVMDVFTPGDHGSTFGGNALACAVGEEALILIGTENLCQRAEEMGHYLHDKLSALGAPEFSELRGRGLMRGIALNKPHCHAQTFCAELLKRRVLSKDTHGNAVRLSPPLVISTSELDIAINAIKETLHAIRQNQNLSQLA